MVIEDARINQDMTGETPNRRSVLVGLVGRGIQLSRTPVMHETEGFGQNLNYLYQLLDVAEMADNPGIESIVTAAELCGFAGLNVTYPYKVEVIDCLNGLSDAASAVGAVNTVVFRDGGRFGHNTDLWGFSENFRRNMGDVRRSAVLLLGAGGAGAAVAHALADCHVEKLMIADTDASKAAALAEALNHRYGSGRAFAVDDTGQAASAADGIVNATPVGMANLPGLPLPEAFIRPEMWVADIVYFPLETELLRVARLRGCRTLSGAGMAVFQAVRAFELFTGLTPDVARMEAAFAAFEEAAPQ
ncbi:MAG: shikimate dehydrogenase (NADP(+)) [Rhizobiaceae bacterium MnEN-MB40S]|nr:MAG: shikimate dehydrogenase (NADP(+)) [Rhizobiaceae bacterium MnEN-MB40S]